MSLLDRADVQKIADLARLSLDEAQLESYAQELTRILGLVEQLESARTEAVEPMAHPLHMAQRLRVDEVTEVDRREQNQAVAPCVEAGLYLVPKVIE